MPGRQAPEGLLKDPSVRLRRRRSGPGRLHAPELRAGTQVSLPSKLGATATPKPQTLGRGQTVTSPPSRRGMQIRAPGSSWDLPAELGDGQFLRRRSGPPPLAPGRGASGPDAPQPPARGRRGGRATPGPSPHPEPRAPRPAPSRPPLGPPATVECRRRRARLAPGAGEPRAGAGRRGAGAGGSAGVSRPGTQGRGAGCGRGRAHRGSLRRRPEGRMLSPRGPLPEWRGSPCPRDTRARARGGGPAETPRWHGPASPPGLGSPR